MNNMFLATVYTSSRTSGINTTQTHHMEKYSIQLNDGVSSTTQVDTTDGPKGTTQGHLHTHDNILTVDSVKRLN